MPYQMRSHDAMLCCDDVIVQACVWCSEAEQKRQDENLKRDRRYRQLEVLGISAALDVVKRDEHGWDHTSAALN